MNFDNFFAQVKNQKLRRSDWSEDEYFVPYQLIMVPEQHSRRETYYLLGQYFLNEIEFIICEQEVDTGFEPNKYGTKWEIYNGNKNYDYSSLH